MAESENDVRQKQRQSKERIEQAILHLAKTSPRDFTADDVRVALGDTVLNDPDFRSEMMGGAFSALSQRNLIKSIGSRTSQYPGMKNRRVTVYAATDNLTAAKPAPSGGQTNLVGSTANALNFIQAAHLFAQSIGFICEIPDLANFFLSLQAKPFIILSGISGTGKSLLPKIFADLLGADFISIPVKPNWNENSYLMGYYSVSHDDFTVGPMTSAILNAAKNPSMPTIVRLDEMNLAHVEHYFSDLLSIMENRRREDGHVLTDPVPLDLPSSFISSTKEKEAKLARLRELQMPWNLFVIGTVNVDETTHPFSRKVLDRSFAIEFSNVDLGAFSPAGTAAVPIDGEKYRPLLLDRPLSIHEVYSSDQEFFQEIAGRLQEVNSILATVELHFGYRVRDEICLYMYAWKRHALEPVMTHDEALDFCIMQKVLPRCHGTSEASRRAIEQIFMVAAGGEPRPDLDLDRADVDYPLPGRRYRRTAEKTSRMLRQYRETGYFSFWNS